MQPPALHAWLGPDDPLWRQLTPDSRRALQTAAGLRPLLPQVPDADWSPAVSLVFKALELEVLVRVLRPFRTFMRMELLDGPLDTALAKLEPTAATALRPGR